MMRLLTRCQSHSMCLMIMLIRFGTFDIFSRHQSDVEEKRNEFGNYVIVNIKFADSRVMKITPANQNFSHSSLSLANCELDEQATKTLEFISIEGIPISASLE
jgi:hypothetical protein